MDMQEKNAKKLTRVERLIRNAFADLLEEKDFASIKVTDIIQKAEVSRSAFYSHYEDKYDLIDQIERELLQGFVDRMQQIRIAGLEYSSHSQEDEVSGSLESAYFQYIAQEKRWWELFMTGRGRSDFVQRFTHVIYDQFAGTAESWDDPEDPLIPRPIGLAINAWSYVGVFSFWIETGMKRSPEEMGRVLAVYWHRFKRWVNCSNKDANRPKEEQKE